MVKTDDLGPPEAALGRAHHHRRHRCSVALQTDAVRWEPERVAGFPPAAKEAECKAARPEVNTAAKAGARWASCPAPRPTVEPFAEPLGKQAASRPAEGIPLPSATLAEPDDRKRDVKPRAASEKPPSHGSSQAFRLCAAAEALHSQSATGD